MSIPSPPLTMPTTLISILTDVVCCNESDARIDPSRYFNLSANNTSVIKTQGGRTEGAINSLYSIDHSSRIGMIVVVQHTSKHSIPSFLASL